MITAQAEEIKKAFISAVRFDGLVRLGVEPGETRAKRGRATAALGVGWATFSTPQTGLLPHARIYRDDLPNILS